VYSASSIAFIETCATIFWERAEGETSWETFVYYVGNSNMGTVLDSSSSSGNRCDYIHDQLKSICKRTKTLIIGNTVIVALCVMQWRTKIRIVSHIWKAFQLKTTCYDSILDR